MSQRKINPKQQQKHWVYHGLLEEKKLSQKIKAKGMDIIYSYHVFEHLEDPLVMLHLGRQWLSHGGKMVITCPNVEGYFPTKDLSHWRCSLSSHRWLPGKSTLLRAIEENGFTVMKVFTYGGFAAPKQTNKSKTRERWRHLGNRLLKCMGRGDVICVMAKKQ